MLKKIKIKNSIVIFIGLLLIIIGFFIGSFEYLKSKKDKAFSKMNIMLYESEIPQSIVSEEEIQYNYNEEEIKDEPNSEEETTKVEEVPKKQSASYNYIGTLEIPKINIKRGFLDLNSKYNNVNYNVTVINGSTFPDQKNNNLILAAHSGGCWYCYFTNLYKLEVGDQAYITYKGNKYVYNVVNIYEVDKTGTVTIYRNYNKSVLTLITCTRNSNTKQTVYILELQE